MRVLVIFFVLIFYACSNKPQEVSPENFLKLFGSSENGFSQTRELDNLYFKVSFRPGAYFNLKSLENELASMPVLQLDSCIKNIDSSFYLVIDIGSLDKKTDILRFGTANDEAFQERVSYYNSIVSDDIQCEINGEIVHPKLHHFQRNFKMAHFNSLIFCFDILPRLKGDLKVVFTDKVYGHGLITFDFDKRLINNIPTIAL